MDRLGRSQGPERAGIVRLGLGWTLQPVPGRDGFGVLGSLKVLRGPAFSRPVAVTLGPASLLALAMGVKGKDWSTSQSWPGERGETSDAKSRLLILYPTRSLDGVKDLVISLIWSLGRLAGALGDIS